uniref:Uncharacterized protein n=1 Tax=Rhizophora mucronata TaxID=61149 RepID=A0A2P2N8Z6_RHIMU
MALCKPSISGNIYMILFGIIPSCKNLERTSAHSSFYSSTFPLRIAWYKAAMVWVFIHKSQK